MENSNNKDDDNRYRNSQGNQPQNSDRSLNTNTKEERDGTKYQNPDTGKSPQIDRDTNQSAYDSGTNPDRYTSENDNLGKNPSMESEEHDVTEVEDNDLIPTPENSGIKNRTEEQDNQKK